MIQQQVQLALSAQMVLWSLTRLSTVNILPVSLSIPFLFDSLQVGGACGELYYQESGLKWPITHITRWCQYRESPLLLLLVEKDGSEIR